MAADRRDPRRAARELLGDELAGGRYLLAPRGGKGPRAAGRGAAAAASASADPAPSSADPRRPPRTPTTPASPSA
ncbi:MAG TPA: hypothetical protein PK280_00470 [Planctomycetota bacterium]|nr:hypothetical protein [Planctomycetota bacterium]